MSAFSHTASNSDIGQARSLVLLAEANLQTNFLANTISEQLGKTCSLAKPGDLLGLNEGSIVILDCHSFTLDALNTLLEQLHRSDLLAALLNTPQEASYENLTEWPHVKGLFYHNCQPQHLVSGLQALLGGELWLPRDIMQRLIKERRKPPKSVNPLAAKLTRRELQILQHLIDGATNQTIADALCVSEHTVKSHLYNVFKKIGVSNRLQACNWAKHNL